MTLPPQHGTMAPPDEPIVLIVLRCWSEDGSPGGFRAHLTVIEDVGSGQSSSRYLASLDDLLAAVRERLAPIAGVAV